MSETDLQLLARYTRQHAEDAFAEIVRRHLNLVYSAALRQVRSPQLAEEVAQSVFTDLARQAQRLASDTVLTAWLYQITRRTAIDVVRRESRRQLREQIAVEMNAMNATAAEWTDIEPLLDEAMHALDETDRAAVLLRYFENKSLREVGQALGTSDDAAQKRVSRAVDRLREFFTKRGVTVGASGLAVAISTNAVQSAPIGLALTISTAATLVGAAIETSTAIATTQTIAMTTMQKTIIGAILTAAIGAGIYEANQASRARNEVARLQQQHAPLNEEIGRLHREHDQAAKQLAVLAEENELLRRNSAELHRLRGEVAQLRHAPASRVMEADSRSPQAETNENNEPSPEDIGRELGMAVVRGDPGALERLLELHKSEQARLDPELVSKAKTNQALRSQLAYQAAAPKRAAFEVIGEAASSGNQIALDAVAWASHFSELSGQAIKCLGRLAAEGNEAALESLIHPDEFGFLRSTTVIALKSVADTGNQKAIDALSAVTRDVKQQALWYVAAQGLEEAAATGNSVAIDALSGLSTSANPNVRKAALRGLRRAAAGQNAQATEALRAMDAQ